MQSACHAIRSSLLPFCLLLSAPLWAQARFSATVQEVLDGDTLVVLRAGQPVTIRLYGIDCPEAGQEYGPAATDFLRAKLSAGSAVSILDHGKDTFGRTVGEVFTAEGQSAEELLVRAGLAWWYHWYAPEQRVLGFLETEARAKRLGLWAEVSPVPPWAYRKQPSGASPAAPPAPSIDTRITPREMPRSPAVQPAKPPAEKPTGVVFVTNTRRLYHREPCPTLTTSKKPITRGLAEVQGYTPCPRCKP